MVSMEGEEATSQTKTTIDSMIELLRDKGKMELSQISQTLGIDQTVVENWAKVLERGNLVKISYEVGKMFVAPYSLTPEQESSVGKEVQARTSSIESSAASGLLSLDSLSETLKGISTSIEAAERLESSQMPQMRKALSQINSIYESVDQKTRAIDQMAKRASELYDVVNKRAADLEAKISQIESTTSAKGLEDARQQFTKILSDASEMDKQIGLIEKSAHDSVDQLRKAVDEQIRQIHQQLDAGRKSVDDKIKEYSRQLSISERDLRNRVNSASSTMREVNDFERDKEKANKRIRDIRTEFNDAYSKTSKEIERSKAELDETSKSLLGQIDNIRKGFGDAAEIDDAIARTKAEVASIESEIAAQRAELNGIVSELHGVLSGDDGHIGQKKDAVEKVGAKADKAASNVGSIRKKVKKASDEAERIGKKEEEGSKE